jgi:hypothetical protein
MPLTCTAWKILNDHSLFFGINEFYYGPLIEMLKRFLEPKRVKNGGSFNYISTKTVGVTKDVEFSYTPPSYIFMSNGRLKYPDRYNLPSSAPYAVLNKKLDRHNVEFKFRRSSGASRSDFNKYVRFVRPYRNRYYTWLDTKYDPFTSQRTFLIDGHWILDIPEPAYRFVWLDDKPICCLSVNSLINSCAIGASSLLDLSKNRHDRLKSWVHIYGDRAEMSEIRKKVNFKQETVKERA